MAILTLFVLAPVSEWTVVYGQGFQGIPVQGSPGQRLQAAGLEIGRTLPADLSVYDVMQEKVNLKSLLEGQYTVIVSGCLTCPAFLRSYPGVEAVYRDYVSRGVHFYYLYKVLAHPENNGYVKAFAIEERFAHIEEAKRKLGTQVPWLCDPMSNEVTNAFGTTPNSEFIFDTDGKIVHLQVWSDGRQLRKALEELVGPVENPTEVGHLPEVIPMSSTAQGVVPRVSVPETLIPIKLDPKVDGSTFYVKLRAEVDDALLRTGSGRMYLGFHLDPIHHVHWNNLVDPVKYELTLPAGTTVTPPAGSAPKVEQASDNDPREFLVDVEHWRTDESIELTVNYYACDEEDKWCNAVTQNYAIHLEQDPFGGGVIGRSFRGRRRGNPGGTGGGFGVRLMRFDENGDGKISKEEAPNRVNQRFDRFDSNDDGYIDKERNEAA